MAIESTYRGSSGQRKGQLALVVPLACPLPRSFEPAQEELSQRERFHGCHGFHAATAMATDAWSQKRRMVSSSAAAALFKPRRG